MAHHDPLKALGPIDWSDVPQDNLNHFLSSTFSQAQTVINSIPIPPKQNRPPQTGRVRSHTDSSVNTGFDPSRRSGRQHANTTAAADNEAAAIAAAHAAQLQKEWKEVKITPRDNPLDISVYKLSAKDGRGAWFARRSIHNEIPFDKFKLGLEREFAETMKNTTGPGTGNVRGIGAERRAEHVLCEGLGKAEVWLLSAQFPGPTTPRDFVTLLLTSSSDDSKKGKVPRQFMVVSKPCNHPDCQPRSGYIRGCYESVEIIREVPTEGPIRRVRSSVDLRREDIKPPSQQSKDIVSRSAAGRAAVEPEQNLARSMSELLPRDADDDSGVDIPGMKTDMAVEWIMITRSDPGGSVPRFMVEKGTPGGIVNDAGRFLNWLELKKADDFQDSGDNNFKEEAMQSERVIDTSAEKGQTPPELTAQKKTNNAAVQEQVPPSGLYSMITGVLGAASSAVAARLPNFPYPPGTETDPENTTEVSDTESEDSFASAPEPEEPTSLGERIISGGDLTSLHSSKSEESATKASATQHEKQLKKLVERYRKLEEKMARQQERSLQGKQHQGNDGLAKLKEKHEKEVARQEENYRKEMRKLEEKRLKEERKAEERRKKEAEKEAKNNLTLELERTRVERDMALKQIDILKEQVGELQAQNTKLVANLGKLGVLGKTDELLGNGVVAKVEEKRASQASLAGSK